MSDKSALPKKDNKKPSQDIVVLIERKMAFFQEQYYMYNETNC